MGVRVPRRRYMPRLAFGAVVAGAHRLAALRRGGSISPDGAKYERSDLAHRATARCNSFRPAVEACGDAGARLPGMPVRPRPRRRPSGDLHRISDAARGGEARSVEFRCQEGCATQWRARSGIISRFIWVEALPAARKGAGTKILLKPRCRRDARCHRQKNQETGPRSGAHRRERPTVQDALPRHMTRTAHAATMPSSAPE